MNAQHRKEFKSIKQFQTETPFKNSIESMGSGSIQCQDTVSGVKYRAAVSDPLMINTLKQQDNTKNVSKSQ